MSELLTVMSTCGFAILVGFFFRLGWMLATAVWECGKAVER